MKLIKNTLTEEKVYRYSAGDELDKLLFQMKTLGYNIQQNYKQIEDDESIDYVIVFIKQTNI